MRTRTRLFMLAFVAAPTIVSAQAPVAKAFKESAADFSKNLIAAVEEMPADKFMFKPTPASMTFAAVVNHLSGGNDFLCGAIGGAKAPTRARLADSAGKAVLVARLKETFAFCETAMASLDDSKLTEMLPMFGGKTMSRAAVMTLTTGDWADHYSQSAIYLRLNGQTPPTAKKP